MLDGIFSKDNPKHIYLMDHKFLSMINIENKQTLLQTDFQINFYNYAAREALRKIDPTLEIKGFYYNICRRPGLKLTQKDGSLRGYEERVFEDIIKRPSWYFFSERHKPYEEGVIENKKGVKVNSVNITNDSIRINAAFKRTEILLERINKL